MFLVALALSVFGGHAKAADNVVMVELFTSQGCSSCPPADETLARLTRQSGVLALSLHVDYWDYLGWRDTFAQSEHTLRQFQYRDLMGARVVYTPQMSIQGRHDVPGFREDLILAAIDGVQAEARSASIVISESSGMLMATVDAPVLRHPRTIWVAAFDREATVDIARGENAGETITYSNVVRNLMKVADWRDGGSQTIVLPQPVPGDGVAIWLQDDRTGQILAASFIHG